MGLEKIVFFCVWGGFLGEKALKRGTSPMMVAFFNTEGRRTQRSQRIFHQAMKNHGFLFSSVTSSFLCVSVVQRKPLQKQTSSTSPMMAAFFNTERRRTQRSLRIFHQAIKNPKNSLPPVTSSSPRPSVVKESNVCPRSKSNFWSSRNF